MDQPDYCRVLQRGDSVENADKIGLDIAAQIVGTIAGCASIGDAKPPPLFFALTEIGLLVARLPRAMTIDRFNRLCRHRAKCRPISWNWRPLRKLGRYPAQVRSEEHTSELHSLMRN